MLINSTKETSTKSQAKETKAIPIMEKQKPLVPPNQKCPQHGTRDECPLVCKYNHFESDDLTIDAWELKCLDCGWRDTIGFRSDEEEEENEANFDPKRCPFCKKTDLPTGQGPCTQC